MTMIHTSTGHSFWINLFNATCFAIEPEKICIASSIIVRGLYVVCGLFSMWDTKRLNN